MAKQNKNVLKEWFKTGKTPTQDHFEDWLDSFVHKDEKGNDEELFKNHLEEKKNPHQVTKTQVGLDQVDNTADIDKPISTNTQNALDLKANKATVDYHLSSTNPHQVTKAQIGLGQVDNTADADKPISTSTQDALDLKAAKQVVEGHLNNKSNPHEVTKAQVGLDQVDNTADADKPISRIMQQALDLKIDKASLSSKAEIAHMHSVEELHGFDTDITLKANSDKLIASQKAIKTYVDNKLTSLVNGSPNLLDTLDELAKAIGEDANFATTITTQLSNKLDKTAALTGEVTGSYSNIILNAAAVTNKPLTNLVIPTVNKQKPIESIASTDKLIDAFGKLQGQLNHMLAIFPDSMDTHSKSEDNPHKVTKQQVGLSNVDNTTDLNKPISTATQKALDLKADRSTLDSHLKDRSNPHKVTKQQIGLANVDNTADINKPISMSTNKALGSKADKEHTHAVHTLQGFDTDVTLAANSDNKVPSQRAIKTYVEATRNTTQSGTPTSPLLKFESGTLLTTPQNGAWEWNGQELYFTAQGIRNKMIHEYVLFTSSDALQAKIETRENKGATASSPTSYSTPVRFLDKTKTLLRLNVLLHTSLESAQELPSASFSATTTLTLYIKKKFSTDQSPKNHHPIIEIAKISGPTNTGLKEISLPILVELTGDDYILHCPGVNNAHIRLNSGHSTSTGPLEVSFGLAARVDLDILPSSSTSSTVNYATTIEHFTLSKVW